ncbi:hypothetical protein HDU78_001472 [Chytriomyces hyalinus]|nr:hypothetical protein HDU78_001472 [Chytriomyces hyalinus]
METLSTTKVHGGNLYKLKMASAPSLGGLPANFAVFVPSNKANASAKFPVLFFLAGLTCTEDNAPQKGSFLGPASENGLAMVFPDTSPRGAGIATEDDSWDFGTGAGFYVDATKSPWSQYYNMASFVTRDLMEAIAGHAPLAAVLDLQRVSVSGHSMGGHGALTLYLKSNLFRCASAFAPICNPSECPWGVKAFSGYLEGGVEEGKKHDATELVKNTHSQSRKLDILIDCGLADTFYIQKQLLPENFEKASRASGFTKEQVSVNLHDGYDHSYYFVSSFAKAHVEWHAQRLKQ